MRVARMSLNNRLRRLEQEHGEAGWCCCPYDDRRKAEVLAVLGGGPPTPDTCADCGGRQIAIRAVEMTA